MIFQFQFRRAVYCNNNSDCSAHCDPHNGDCINNQCHCRHAWVQHLLVHFLPENVDFLQTCLACHNIMFFFLFAVNNRYQIFCFHNETVLVINNYLFSIPFVLYSYVVVVFTYYQGGRIEYLISYDLFFIV